MNLPGLRLLGTFLVAALLPLTTVPARAVDYTLVTGTDYPPYADSGQAEGGLTVRVVESAFAAIGKTVTITTLPWQRGYLLTSQSKFDGTFPYVPAKDRGEAMLYSQPIVMVESRIYSSADRPLLSAAQLDGGGRRYCSPIGYALPARMQDLVDAKAIVMFRPASMLLCLRMLEGNHADFLTGDPRVVESTMAGTGMKFIEGDALSDPIPLMLIAGKANPKSPALIADFDAGLGKIKASGLYARLTRIGS